MPAPSITRLRGGSHIPRHAFARYEFAVCDYSLLGHEVGKPVQSPTWILQDGSQWILNFFPHGGSERSLGFVSLELICLTFGVHAEMNARLSVSLLGHSKKEATTPEQSHERLDTLTVKSPSALPFKDAEGGRKSWAIDNFINEEAILKYVADDSLVFAVEIEILGKPETLSTTMPAFIGSTKSLHEDMASLLEEVPTGPGPHPESTNFSDITLVFTEQGTDKKELGNVRKFRVHRAILAARSVVFRRKLGNASFHAKLFFNGGAYYVEDADPTVYKGLLTFVYTDELDDELLAVSSHELLKAAARWKIERLEHLTEDYIGETLSPHNVVAALSLAIDLKKDRLEACCSEFISQHSNEVTATNTLQSLSAETLKLLMDRSLLAGHMWSHPHSPELNANEATADLKTAGGDKAADLKRFEQEETTRSPLQQEGGEGKGEDFIPVATASNKTPLQSSQRSTA